MTVTICRPVIQQVKRREIVRQPIICGDGRLRYQFVEVERLYTYTVMLPVQEVRQKEVTAPRLKITLMVEKEGQLIPLREILDGKTP